MRTAIQQFPLRPGTALWSKLPPDWTVSSLRALVTEVNTKNEGLFSENYLSLMANVGVILYADKGDVGNKAPEDLTKCKLVAVNDFVINSMNYGIGSFGISPYDGICSAVYIVLRAQRHAEVRFVSRILEARPFQRLAQSFGNGILEHRRAISWDILKNLRIALPPLDVQRKIADYLDTQTAKIDALIGKQEQLIETLAERRQAVISHAVTKGLDSNAPTKDSGLDWVGQIPSHWGIKRMKNLGSIKYGLGEPPEYVDEGVPLIRATNVSVGRITPGKMAFVNPEDIPAKRIFWLRQGDIIVVRSGALTGDSGLIGSDYEGSIAGFDMVFRSSGLAVSGFIQYTLLSKYVKSAQLEIARMRAAQPHLNAEELGEVTVVLPPVEVQREITSYLDDETAQIDALSAKAREMIDILKERRQALISAAVTGKIDVRGLT